MEKKKLQSISIAALVMSILPLAALVPSFLHLSLSDGVRTAWAGANIGSSPMAVASSSFFIVMIFAAKNEGWHFKVMTSR